MKKNIKLLIIILSSIFGTFGIGLFIYYLWSKNKKREQENIELQKQQRKSIVVEPTKNSIEQILVKLNNFDVNNKDIIVNNNRTKVSYNNGKTYYNLKENSLSNNNIGDIQKLNELYTLFLKEKQSKHLFYTDDVYFYKPINNLLYIQKTENGIDKVYILVKKQEIYFNIIN